MKVQAVDETIIINISTDDSRMFVRHFHYASKVHQNIVLQIWGNCFILPTVK